MRLSKAGAADLRLHEGFVDHWYLDPVGIPTIGIGFTWRSAAFRDWWAKHRPGQAFARGATMSRAEAEDCLVHLCDLEYGKAVNAFLGRVVDQHVFDAMSLVVYNCGAGALGWQWALEVKAGDIGHAALLLQRTATTAAGRTLAGLVKRRKMEAALLLDGSYASGAKAEPAGEIANDMALADGLLMRGERGASVRALQAALTAAGYRPGRIDGVFGWGTEAAVLDFQKRSGLTVDGIAGPRTRAKLAV